VYLGFTFGELEEHHDHVDFEKRTLEFNIVVQYAHHLRPEQIQAAKSEKLQKALEEDAALAALRANFSKAYDDMSPSERRRYDERRALLIENDLATYYNKHKKSRKLDDFGGYYELEENTKSMGTKAMAKRKHSTSALAKQLRVADNGRGELVPGEHTAPRTKTAAAEAGKDEQASEHIG
jgi:hypothetical protein